VRRPGESLGDQAGDGRCGGAYRKGADGQGTARQPNRCKAGNLGDAREHAHGPELVAAVVGGGAEEADSVTDVDAGADEEDDNDTLVLAAVVGGAVVGGALVAAVVFGALVVRAAELCWPLSGV
jgi:hypothetical protein